MNPPVPAPMTRIANVMPYFTGTNCCALGQLTAFNHTSLKDLRSRIAAMKYVGYRACLVVSKIEEPTLVIKLKKLSFKKLIAFNRRHCYGQTPLTLWIKKF